MIEKTWDKVKDVEVPIRPLGVWTLVLDFVPANTVLKFESTGMWQYSASPDAKCGPDGDPTRSNGNLLVTQASVGALVGKLGGSTGGRGDSVLTFVVGSGAVYSCAANSGPLFLTPNLDPAHFPSNKDVMKVTIFEMRE